ncbi:IWS1-like protein [Mizuhopecten yessoensis]|uniref:Protein IWS1-like n=1 Tax=Mizuhopecten yessoensis TaxID=6573 RepID=A0A210PRY3_MIZYE|nr:IWS1-like protein [Mizuhopecten yessoensis]OWF39206.1 Protein IWS1-like [Mizuhopecten yessoensis]
MEEDEYTGSGGSTPVQDEPMYLEGEGPPEEDNEMMNIDHAKGNDSDIGSETGSQRGGIRADDGDAEYVSDGGEVEREEVEQDIVEDEEMHSGDEGPASPTSRGGSYDGSPQGSPDGDRPLSPETPPMSPGSGPASPGDSPPASPAPSGSPPGSPMGSASPPGSPVGSAPHSPAGSGSPPGSPAGNAVGSPMGSGSPASPAGSAPGSPAGSAPGSPREYGSPPGSPAEIASPPGSPVASPMYSPANSCPASPSEIKIPEMSPGSSPASPAGSASPPRSPTGSGSPPQSPTGSGSPPHSPTGSGSVPGSPTGSRRSRSGSPASRSRSRSASGSRSRSRSRSRSGSPASRRSRSRSSSRGSRSRSRSGSPGSRRSRSGSESSRGSPARRRRIDSDSEDEGAKKSHKRKAKGSDEEDDSDKESEVGELIADIFGSSDEEEEFEGFGEEDVEAANKKKEKKKSTILSDDDEDAGEQPTGETDANQGVQDNSDDDVNRDDNGGGFVSDFEVMMMKKKEENRKNRAKRKDFEIINDNDDLIVDMIKKMKEAAEADRELNTKKKPATRKLKYLTDVNSQLKKSDLHVAFLDCGVLSAMTEWLAPLPDKSLPHLQIRDTFLKHLHDFPSVSNEGLKASGIGKAVMYLYKHPRETKNNKERCGKLINDWSRPIFNLTSNYKMLSKEEREQRDYEQLPKRRRLSTEGMTPRRDIDNALSGDQQALRPGDKGWIMRARVPMPSNKDYVVRPKWKVEEMVKSSRKKDVTRYEKHARSFAERKKIGKGQRAVAISIEGKNMAL